MTFTLTRSYLDELLQYMATGNFPAFLEHVDENVEWRMGASDQPGEGFTGVYVS